MYIKNMDNTNTTQTGGSKMKNAREIKYKDLKVGDEFLYTAVAYPAKGFVEKVFKVEDIHVTKTGRIWINKKSRNGWSNGAIKADSFLQE
tara:strand:- start:2 stop:271 length:270 start_codon:yes stop_codon:yes gene_type:complete